jgi:hypothetical protein
MFAYFQKKLEVCGFIKEPYEKNSFLKLEEYVCQHVRLEKSTLDRKGYMLGLRIGLPFNQGVLGFIRPSEGKAVVLDYWMGPNGIKPIEWNDTSAWHAYDKESMLDCFINQGLPWLDEHSDPGNLRTQLLIWQENGWPCPPDWPQENKRVIPIHNLYIAALSEYMNDVPGFLDAINKWIQFLVPSVKIQREERDKCIEYVEQFKKDLNP